MNQSREQLMQSGQTDSNMQSDTNNAETSDMSGQGVPADSQVTCGCRTDSHKTKERSDKEYRDLLNRLKRIEGQIRGIQNMLEDNAYCTDVMVQVSAASSALNSFNRVLLTNHMKTCVADNIRQGNDDVIEELAGLLQKLMR